MRRDCFLKGWTRSAASCLLKSCSSPYRREGRAHISFSANCRNPLSTTSYQGWRVHSRTVKDTLEQADGNLLTLTTKVADSEVLQESLTVRESDFHPISREVVLRNQGKESTTIEIAELSYAVIDPNNLSSALFEDAPAVPPIRSAVVLPPVANLPSEAELDMTELQVRQKLHELGADLGEDIHIERTPQTVEVSGVLSSDERVQSLRGSLYSLPHVVLALHTPQDLRSSGAGEVQDIRQVGSASLDPPLLNELLKQQFPNESDRTAQTFRLLNEADQCAMHARAMSVLLQRYRTLNDPGLRRIADDHLKALDKSTKSIAEWLNGLSPSPNGQQTDSSPITLTNHGNGLVEASLAIERDLGELVSDHSSEPDLRARRLRVVAICHSVHDFRAIVSRINVSWERALVEG
jgi:hypothetical protein